MACRHLIAFCLIIFTLYTIADARYLPTRSQDDRLDKLRDLLKDLLETEVEKPNMNNYDRRILFKRELPLPVGNTQEKRATMVQQ